MSSAKLEYLLIKHCNCNYGAHRADNDCNALIHLLATPFADGSLPMSLLLESARSRTVRVSARGAAFEKKDLLKSRGYRWHAGSDGNEKHWYRDVREKEGDAEKQWLRDNVFGGIPVDPPTTIFTALDRYSHRV